MKQALLMISDEDGSHLVKRHVIRNLEMTRGL